jgi:hypothetical protein
MIEGGTVMDAISSLENDTDVIYALDRALRITYCNQAWDRFAAANGAPELQRLTQRGRCVLDVIADDLKPFYRSNYETAFLSRRPWAHEYECSSPTEYRKFRMIAHPTPAGFLVVVNSLLVERPHGEERIPHALNPKCYRDRAGVTTMCAHCRRTRRVEAAEAAPAWDWVPDYLVTPPKLLSHSVCPACMTIYFPQYG